MKNNKIWSNMVNLSGLYSDKPVSCYYNKTLDSWWDKLGDYEITKLGYMEDAGCVYFSSENKEEVEHFILGAKAVMSMLRKWAE